MEISDVRVKLIQDSSDRLKAVCSITLDDEFVVRDLKVVEGTNGLFVAMPSRKLSVHCPQCRSKNHLRARFCNECGTKLPPARTATETTGRMRMHRDIAHPINPTFREFVQSRVIEKYREEAELAKNPNYVPVDIDAEFEEKVAEIQQQEAAPRYAPSEYDQLIAGLNKGAEAPREREPRPQAPRPRSNDRRTQDDRSNRGRAWQPRPGQRGESRRHESSRPPRNQPAKPRPPLPSIMETDVPDEVLDQINGNVAAPEPTREPRRPAPPRRSDDRPRSRRPEPRPARSTSPPPASRFAEETTSALPRSTETSTPSVSPSADDTPVRMAELPAPPPPPAPPAPAAPAKTPGRADDLPFGAGL